MALAHLSLGSNLGDRLAYLQGALDGLLGHPEIAVIAVSHVYETDPVGGPVQDDYLNVVVKITTELSAYELLAFTQGLELAALRVRKQRWGPRTLDVDILLYDDLVQDDPGLTIPHPRMFERGFVITPLRDVSPDLAPASVVAGGGVRPLSGVSLRH